VLGGTEEGIVELEIKDLNNFPLHFSHFIIITFMESDDLTNVLLTVSSIKAATYVSFLPTGVYYTRLVLSKGTNEFVLGGHSLLAVLLSQVI